MAARGKKLPALAGKPHTPEHLQIVLDAVADLWSERPIGAMGGAGPLYWSAVRDWALFYGIDDAERFIELVQHVDYLKLQAANEDERVQTSLYEQRSQRR